MTPQERKAFRPTTVKRNILGSIRAIRGTRKQIESWKNDPTALEGQIEWNIKLIKQFWAERKANKWTN